MPRTEKKQIAKKKYHQLSWENVSTITPNGPKTMICTLNHLIASSKGWTDYFRAFELDIWNVSYIDAQFTDSLEYPGASRAPGLDSHLRKSSSRLPGQ